MRRLILLVLVCDSLCDESEKCGPLFVDRFLITRRCTGRTTVFTSTTTITLLPTVLSTVTTSCYVRAKKDCPQRRRRSTYIEEALHQEQVFPEEIKNIEEEMSLIIDSDYPIYRELEGSQVLDLDWKLRIWRLWGDFRLWPFLPITLRYIETDAIVSTVSKTSTFTTTNSITVACNPTFAVQFCP